MVDELGRVGDVDGRLSCGRDWIESLGGERASGDVPELRGAELFLKSRQPAWFKSHRGSVRLRLVVILSPPPNRALPIDSRYGSAHTGHDGFPFEQVQHARQGRSRHAGRLRQLSNTVRGNCVHDGPHGTCSTPAPQRLELVIPRPRIAIDPVGRNEQSRRRSFDANIARSVDVADAAVTEEGTDAGGKVGDRYYRYRPRQLAVRDRRDLLDRLEDATWLQSSLDLDGKDRGSLPWVTQSRPAGPRGSDRSALRSGRKVTSRVELVQPERARRGVRPVLRSVAVCLEEAWIAYAAKAVSM